MENNKRQFREMNPETKAKISQSMKNKSKSFSHRENISNGMREYWKNVPSRPTNDTTSTNGENTACKGDKICQSVSENNPNITVMNDKI